ncbi:MAG: FAD-dependent oxidoreductase [Clostridiales bacterium]|jgi:thioredoxin reductase (NADPH)|nr:FAD-dependent oxidoreductase [Clostridiales bacterium]
MHDIIIIGGGPAGMTAALYALRCGKSVLIFEKAGVGGQIALSPRVENLPGTQSVSGTELADRMLKQILDLGADFEIETVNGVTDEGNIKRVITESGTYECRAVIIAAGARHRRLGLPGEEQLAGFGVSYCAACDGAFFSGLRTAVVGGGSTAVQDALRLSQICEKVYVIYRRPDFFRAEIMSVEALRARENVRFLFNSEVTALFQENGSLTGVEVTDKSGEKSRLDVDGLFIAVGLEPDNGIFSGLIPLDEGGYVQAGESCETPVPGIFAAGDCRTKTVRQLTTAMADGTVAGLAACRYIETAAGEKNRLS